MRALRQTALANSGMDLFYSDRAIFARNVHWHYCDEALLLLLVGLSSKLNYTKWGIQFPDAVGQISILFIIVPLPLLPSRPRERSSNRKTSTNFFTGLKKRIFCCCYYSMAGDCFRAINPIIKNSCQF